MQNDDANHCVPTAVGGDVGDCVISIQPGGRGRAGSGGRGRGRAGIRRKKGDVLMDLQIGEPSPIPELKRGLFPGLVQGTVSRTVLKAGFQPQAGEQLFPGFVSTIIRSDANGKFPEPIPTTADVVIPAPINPIPKKRARGPTKKEQLEVMVSEVKDWLPILKKRAAVDSKAIEFSVEDLHDYDLEFADPDTKCAYLLPLFHFLNETSVLADAMQEWEQVNVSIEAGIKKVEEIFKAPSAADMPEDDKDFLRRRFGKRWWKIPKKDKARVKTLFTTAPLVRISLVGIEANSFRDRQTNEMVQCLMPVMRYEAYTPPAPKPRAPRKQKTPKQIIQAVENEIKALEAIDVEADVESETSEPEARSDADEPEKPDEDDEAS